MSPDRLYKQAIKRAFAGKYREERVAIYWGRGDDTIHVIAALTHHMHSIVSGNSNTLEFVTANGDRIVVALTDEECRQLGHVGV